MNGKISLLFTLIVATFANSRIFGFSPSRKGSCMTQNARRFSKRCMRCVMRLDSGSSGDSLLEDGQYGDSEEDRDEVLMHFLSGPDSTLWTLPNRFEMFLNQCAIQSFLFLLKSLRDPQTVMWLEEFTQPDGRVTATREPPFHKEGQTAGSFSSKLLVYGFDIELNENGQLQASRVAQELADVVLGRQKVVLASSHLQRAAQTADIMNQLWKTKHQDLEISRAEPMKEFGEMRFGSLEGNALRGPEATDESRALFRDNNYKMTQDKHLCWPGGGESTVDVEARGLDGLDTLVKRYPDADLLVIVAHGRFNKIILASLLYGNVLKHSEVEQGNTCINVIDQRKDGKYEQVILNYLRHLHRELV